MIRAACSEVLERRTLFDFQLDGTPGSDTIQVLYDFSQNEYRFTLNGAPAGTTQDSEIRVWAGAGDDYVTIPVVTDGTSLTVRGNSGNDTVDVGSGHLADSVKGTMLLEYASGGSIETVIARDSLDNAVLDRSVTFRESSVVFYTHALYTAGGGSVHFDQYTNFITLLSSSSADTVYVENAPAGMSLFLGDGNDTVIYGDRSGHVVQAVMPACSVSGGAGVDRIEFDDANGPTLQGRVYDFTANTAMNQRLFDVEQVEVNTRNTGGVGDNSHNDVLFTGIPVSSSVTIDGGGLDDLTYIGTPTSPIDLDDLSVTVTTSNPGNKYVYDQIDDVNLYAFLISTGGSPLRQFVQKGAFTAGFVPVDFDVNRYIDIHGGSTSDGFGVFNTLENRNVGFYGNGGNDQVFNATHDLDAVFNSPFHFAGGDGDDRLTLNDSQDQTNDDDNEYRLLPGFTGGYRVFDKVGSGGPVGPSIMYSDSVERITLTADNGPSTIRFQGLPTQLLTLDGGGGDDFFTNARAGQPGSLALDSAGSTTLTGGSGNDTISINDQANQLVSHYSVSDGQVAFWFFNDHGTIGYDATTENYFLDQSNGPTTTSVSSKPAAMRLSVAGYGGNDTFVVGGGDIDGSGISSTTTTLLGGTGDDRIEFDDRLDDHNVSDADTFTFNFQQVTKDGTTILYGGFESQKLYTSGVNNSSVWFPNTVRIDRIDMPTEVIGSTGDRDNIVDVGNMTLGLSQIFGAIALDFVTAPVVVNVNDQVAGTDRLYDFSAAGLIQPIPVNYSGVAALNLFAGSGHDTLMVNAVPVGMSVFFSGNSGDEFIFLGNGGPLSDVAGRVNVNGDAGFDSLFIRNGPEGGFTDAVLTSSSFSANGGPVHLYGTVERLQVIVNDDGSNIDLLSTMAATSIVGGAGDDHVVIGGGDLDANITAAVHVGGAAGNDLVEYDDSADVPDSNNNYLLQVQAGTDLLLRLAGDLSCVGVEERILHGNDGISLYSVRDTISDLRINANGGNDLLTAFDSTGVITFSSGAGVDFLEVNSDAFAPATVVIDQHDEVNSLLVYPGGTVRVISGAVLCNSPNPFSGNVECYIGGTMDLAGGAFLSRNGPMAPSQAEFRGLLTVGYNGGAWNGSGPTGAINSSLAAGGSPGDAVGYGLGDDLAISSIGPFSINPADTLVRYTYYGDTDLNGQVDFDDYVRTDSGLNNALTGWTNGDFDFSNSIDFDDYVLIDLAFNTQSGVR